MCDCVENRRRLALHVGQETGATLPEDLRRSLASCPQCRAHYEQLIHSQRALRLVQEDEACLLTRSLWPELAPRLTTRPVREPWQQRFRRQLVPAFSLTAACLALLMVFLDGRPQHNQRVYQTTSQLRQNSGTLPLVPVGSRSWSQADTNRFDWGKFPDHAPGQDWRPAFPSAEGLRNPLIPSASEDSQANPRRTASAELLLELLRMDENRD